MNWRDVLTAATVLLYFCGGLGGWVLCGAAQFSRRFTPALAQAGTAIGIFPTYLLAIWTAGKLGHRPVPGTIWILLSLFAVTLAIVVLTVLATIHALRAWRAERAEERLRAGAAG